MKTSTITLIFSVFLLNASFAITPPKEGVEVPDHFFRNVQIIGQSYQSGGLYRAVQNKKSGLRALKVAENLPVLLGRYSDSNDDYSQSQFQNLLFDNNPTGTMSDYFSEVSYGQFNLTGTVYDWATASQPQSFYDDGNNGLEGGGARFCYELAELTDADIDYGQFDNDGPDGVPNSGDDDGYVDVLNVVHTGGGAETGDTDNLWSHRWNFGSANYFYSVIMPYAEYTTNDASANGGFIKIDDYVIQPETNRDGTLGEPIIEIGVFCHEFGHALGLPDLYDTDGSSNGIGGWGLMGSGSSGGDGGHPETPSHMSAWSKVFLGWTAPTVISSNTSSVQMPNAADNSKAYKLWTDGNPGSEYFLVENRYQTGFDTYLPGSGLCIWHIDEDVINANTSSNTVNADENHKGVDMEEADGLNDLDYKVNGGDASDVFPGSSNNTTFNGDSNPNSDSYSGNETYVAVLNIGDSGPTMTADLFVSDTTFVSGFIIGHVTWIQEESPYVVTGNVSQFFDTDTLTIEPGVEVRFTTGKVLTLKGTLFAIGTADAPIIFTSNKTEPAAGDWGYILFESTTTDATYDIEGNYLSGNIMEYCKVEYAGGLGVEENGGVRIENAFPFINHCTIQNNSASGIRAWDLEHGTLYITNSEISNNTFSGYDALGGGIYAAAVYYTSEVNMIIDNCDISNNAVSGTSTINGGGIYHNYLSATITNNMITNNVSSSDGGGIYSDTYETITDISNNTFRNNTAGGSGGAINLQNGPNSSISNNLIENNTAGSYGGGGIYIDFGSETLLINDNEIIGNTAEAGGGIYIDGDSKIINNTITGNIATSSVYEAKGGGIYIYVSDPIVTNNTIVNNISDDHGGGIYVSSYSPTIDHNNISQNEATNGYGGAIYIEDIGEPILNYNQLTNNTANNTPAVFYNNDSSTPREFTFNDITGNIATGSGETYTIYIFDGLPLFNYNNIFNNTTNYELWNNNEEGTDNVDATNNWWGTKDFNKVAGKIWDGMDDATLGMVDFFPYLDGPVVLGELTLSSLSIDFGDVGTGETATEQVTVTNTGAVDLNVTAIAITGADAENFSVDTTPFTLIPNDSKNLAVSFTPDASGSFAASLNFESDGGNASVALAGNGVVSAPEISIAPLSIDFGDVGIVDTATAQVKVSNIGTVDLNVSSIAISGVDADNFSVDTTHFTLAAGANKTLDVSFTPDASGSFSASLDFDSDGGSAGVTLSGNGFELGISITPLSINFSNVDIGDTATAQVTVFNIGTGDLNISSITISGVDSVNFTVDTTLFTVVPADSHSLDISFTPDTSGSFRASLDIDSDGGSGSVGLTGYGGDNPAPSIISITDVPDDQGRWVYLSWESSMLDTAGDITQYGVWELNPDSEWVSLGHVPSIQAEDYIFLAHTFGDSTADSLFWSTFMVTAHTTVPEVFFTSEVDSGYSIDNLAPAVPTGLLAAVTEENTVALRWDSPVDEDFNYFRIYRSLEPDFDPTGMEPFAETIDTTFIDSDVEIGETYYYILSAVDFNGNESEYSEAVEATVVLSIDDLSGIPTEFALRQNYPNPFNPATTLRYDLPEQAFVTLVVYDLLGREVKRLVSGIVVSGYHAVVWDGTNNNGQLVGAGVYLYRISTDKFTKVNKMILLR
ncbi:MAG: M6 family metalloprotease domain-containing protein [Candidatus Marinimicrobia bacterium]|nr:M6 family metalloprotease domain-containing protein [Candidatus Neomarinimicrobiota bacterium]